MIAINNKYRNYCIFAHWKLPSNLVQNIASLQWSNSGRLRF